jgi:hypothetical protein
VPTGLDDLRVDDAEVPESGEKGGGGSVSFACVRALLRADSEAHPRCPARHAKSGKQVRALIPLQPSRVVDYASCDIGEERDGGCQNHRCCFARTTQL